MSNLRAALIRLVVRLLGRHNPRTGKCPACGFEIRQAVRMPPIVFEDD